MSLTPEEREAIRIARELIAGGIPVFAAAPALDAHGNWDPQGGTGKKQGNGCGYWLPNGWEKTVPTENWLNPNAPGFADKAWRPGWALCAVMGQGLDLLDVDPRNGGDATREALLQADMWPRVYGAASTPSGGTHEFVTSLNVGSRDGVQPGLDVKGGLPDGNSRGFAFIAPTLKASKSTGEIVAYRWTSPPDLDALTDGDDDSGEGIAELVRQARGSKNSPPPSDGADPFSDLAERKHAGPIPDGKRHGVLVSYAGWLRSIGLPLAEAEACMERRWQDCAQPQPGSPGRSSATPLPWPDARYPLPVSEAYEKLHDAYGRWPAGREIPEDAGQAPEGAESAASASWAPVALDQYLDGSYEAVLPTLMPRTDGQALLYPGLVHSFHGESESGKSLLLQIEAARLIALGEDVLFLDFESDAGSVTERLLTFGASPGDILTHFTYVRPHTSHRNNLDERAAWNALLERRYALAVIDGVTDALGLFGFKTKENDDITDWMRQFPKLLAERTGAAVAMVDHVTKDSAGRGRFAIGGQAKMNALTGAAYVVEVGSILGRGLRGEITLRVAKDRPGQIRPHCGTARMSDRTQEAARVVVDSREPAKAVATVEPYRTGAEVRAGEEGFRPTALMQRTSLRAEEQPGLTKNKLAAAVGGKKEYVLIAIGLLVAEGYLRVETVGNSQKHYSEREYRRALDPLDEDYVGPGTDSGSEQVVPGSRPYTGGRGTGTNLVPGTDGEPMGTGELIPLRSTDQGPCGRCGRRSTRRYGDEAETLCDSCQPGGQAAVDA